MVSGGNETVISVEDSDQDADLAQREALEEQLALPFSNDSVDHEVEYGR